VHQALGEEGHLQRNWQRLSNGNERLLLHLSLADVVDDRPAVVLLDEGRPQLGALDDVDHLGGPRVHVRQIDAAGLQFEEGEGNALN